MTRVSVCLCTYNGARWVARAIESVLSQTYGDLELLVVDDASQDETLEVVAGYGDARLRVIRGAENLGQARNRSRAVRESRGELIKFVDQDDWLDESCIAEHERVLRAHPTVGFTFSRRGVDLEDPGSADAVRWAETYAHSHHKLGSLQEVNDGPELLRRYISMGLRDNYVGEPTSVMMRKECLNRTRLFNQRLLQVLDLDLWIRLMAFYDVGFLDAELATRHVGPATATHSIRADRHDWLDRLWMLEGFKELPALWNVYPELSRMRRTEQKSLVAALVTARFRTSRTSDALSDSAGYVAHVVRRAAGRAPSVLECL